MSAEGHVLGYIEPELVEELVFMIKRRRFGWLRSSTRNLSSRPIFAGLACICKRRRGRQERAFVGSALQRAWVIDFD